MERRWKTGRAFCLEKSGIMRSDDGYCAEFHAGVSFRAKTGRGELLVFPVIFT